jgi:PKD repeat protein
MRTILKISVIFMVALLIHAPRNVLAVGEYNGVWVGPITTSGETWNDMFVIYQDTGDRAYVSISDCGSVQLVPSGGNWVLSAPASTYCGTFTSMTVTFQSQNSLTGSASLDGESVTFSSSKQNCQSLSNDVPVQNLSGSEESFRCFQIDLPALTTGLDVTTEGGTGDCDLYVEYYRPDFDLYISAYDYNYEDVYISSPASGRWYVVLYGWDAYSGVNLLATYQAFQAAQAAFTASPTSGRVPLAVTFTDQSSGDINAWAWDFGDGATSTEQNPTHTYRRPGTYTVSLTVSGPGGSDTETKPDLISASPGRSMPGILLLLTE